VRAPLVAAIAVLAAGVAWAAAGDAGYVPPAGRANPGLLSEVMAASGVEREVPKPGWMEYVGIVTVAAFGAVAEILRPLGSLVSISPDAARVVGWAFVAVVLLGVIVIAVRLWPGRRPSPPRAAPSPDLAGAPPAATPADAASWLRALDLRLDKGDVAGALEALWWFLATSIASVEAHPSWTSGELLARARRRELRPLAVQLDRFRYGPRAPTAPDVRGLARRFEEALA
jgi:hypothetical protein